MKLFVGSFIIVCLYILLFVYLSFCIFVCLYSYLLFVIFCMPGHIKAEQRLSTLVSFAIWKVVFGVGIRFIWYFQSTNFPKYQEIL